MNSVEAGGWVVAGMVGADFGIQLARVRKKSQHT
jgi:adenine/guanine phosphoribosyltransferase-like PRPP-binding protein